MNVSRLLIAAAAMCAFAGLRLARSGELDPNSFSSQSAEGGPSAERVIGYTELCTNLLGGRHANVTTMRATLISSDGSGRRLIAEELVREPNSWTQFAGWSPDGNAAIIGRGWESAENGKWEEEHKTFRFAANGWLHDMYLLNFSSKTLTNLTAVERVSFYNSGLFFWPGDSSRFGFQALIDGNSHPFAMRRDGRHKRDLTKDSKQFAYGFNASPDGRYIAYHKNYQICVARADGSDARQIVTGRPFNFAPQWSLDGRWLVFLSGEHYDCHPYVVRVNGTGLRQIGARRGYRGVVEFLDVPDFHGGSSDIPVWSPDSQSVVYTAHLGQNVELYRATLDGKEERLSRSPPGSVNYHPEASEDGKWLVYGSKRGGARQIYVMNLDTKKDYRVTNLPLGHAAMWPHWAHVKK
jgi:TolB protein